MTQQLTLLSFEEKKQNHYVADSYTGIYAMHKYWSKKPYNIIRDFILRYSKEDDIVLDPFCGSGISISESIFSHRKAIGIDINPSAIFITKQMVNKASSSWVQTEFKKIEEDVRKEIDSFYEVKRNDSIFVGTHFLWENGKLSEVWYNTKNPSKKVIDIAHENDLQKSMSFSYENIPFRYPKNNFFHNSRINAKRENHIYDLFTPRNLMALSFLLDRINKVENPEVKELLKFCFTSAVGQASKMVFVIKRRGKFDGTVREAKENNEVGSWVIGYWVPKQHFEINVWNCFENKYKKILKAKKEQEIVNYSLNEAKNFDELQNSKNLLLINQSC